MRVRVRVRVSIKVRIRVGVVEPALGWQHGAARWCMAYAAQRDAWADADLVKVRATARVGRKGRNAQVRLFERLEVINMGDIWRTLHGRERLSSERASGSRSVSSRCDAIEASHA